MKTNASNLVFAMVQVVFLPSFATPPTPSMDKEEFKLCKFFRKQTIYHIKQRLREPRKLNQRCKCCGDGPLHFAVRLNSIELLNTLAINGARYNMVNKRGETPLHVACENNNEDMAARLLDLRASPYRSNHQGETCMDVCIRTGHVNIAELILLRRQINLKLADPDDFLMMAVRQGSTDFVELFIKYNANINYVNTRGKTASSLAVELGQEAVLHCLLWHGADLNQKYTEENDTLLHMACRLNREVCVSKLLLAGASVNALNNKGETPLHVAVEHCSLQIIQMLLSNGSSLEARDFRNLTPLHHAIIGNKPTTVKYLLSRGASTRSAIPSLILAASSKLHDMVKLIISHGIDLDQNDFLGQMLYDAVMMHGNAELIQFFEKHKLESRSSVLL